MSNQLNLHDVDVDGALQESAAEAVEALQASGDTRAAFLRRAGLAGGAFVGSGAVLGALATPALAFTTGDRPPAADFGTGDIAILRFALTLEYLERNFYVGALEHQRKTGFMAKHHQLQVFLRTVVADERKHVEELKHVLGAKALREPKFDYHGDNLKIDTFMRAAFTFENEGVHAYSGQAFNIKNPQILAAALSIVTIEARHASVIGLISHDSEYGISPNGANDVPFGASRVIKDVTSLNYITKLYTA
ncbi:MAG TPA: ferritin-like domain-containing protein [Solirubrobacteraceae bacterium]|nr:ferritin-like domain-containing protein [Solirubrobacteraceae bacterium]